jgi:hypothetical protein
MLEILMVLDLYYGFIYSVYKAVNLYSLISKKREKVFGRSFGFGFGSVHQIFGFGRIVKFAYRPISNALFDHALTNLGRMFEVYELRAGVDNRPGNIPLL